MLRYFVAFLLGLSLGSFANVYFYRFTHALSWIHPRSFCPNCKHPILWQDNIPLISFVLLRGRCRHCLGLISFQYPLLELISALLMVLVTYRFNHSPWEVWILFLWFTFLLILIGGNDCFTYFESGREYGIIPDSLVLILGISALLFSPQNPLIHNFYSSLWGGLGGIGLFYSIRWIGNKIYSKEALGLGDVKFVGALGLWLGWKGVLWTIVISSLLGTVVSLYGLFRGSLNRKSSLPYAPFLALASFCVLFF